MSGKPYGSGASSMEPGDIAVFDFLHLDTAKRLDEPRDSNMQFAYRVMGKPRPMIILRKLDERDYLVAKLTTHPARSGVHRPLIALSQLLGDGRDTYADPVLMRYPKTLLRSKRTTLDPMEFNCILRILVHSGLKASQ